MNKDKADRFFIPIAEEYIKSGMFDEAITVLKEGLQKYPNYLSARVSLGKAYLEKNMNQEAMREFEHVVQLSPDNILAHKKLVYLYREFQRIDDAIKACETLLAFSPKDQEITELLTDLMSEKVEKILRGEGQQTREKSPVAREQEESTIDFTSSWEVEDEAVTECDEVSDELVTETMGDLYIAQGDVEKGADIFMRILEKEPDNEAVKDKLKSSIENTSGSSRNKKIKDLEEFLVRIQRKKREL